MKRDKTLAGGQAADNEPAWHTLTVEATLAILKTARVGLTTDEAGRRLAAYGANELQTAKRVSPLSLLIEQFKNVLIVILLVATGVSAAMGEGVETVGELRRLL